MRYHFSLFILLFILSLSIAYGQLNLSHPQVAFSVGHSLIHQNNQCFKISSFFAINKTEKFGLESSIQYNNNIFAPPVNGTHTSKGINIYAGGWYNLYGTKSRRLSLVPHIGLYIGDGKEKWVNYYESIGLMVYKSDIIFYKKYTDIGGYAILEFAYNLSHKSSVQLETNATLPFNRSFYTDDIIFSIGYKYKF